MSGNEPAFPIQGYGQSADSALAGPYVTAKGMSLRAYFAGQALAGFCADGKASWKGVTYQDEWASMARECIGVADALIAELAKEKA